MNQSADLEQALRTRAGDKCELCNGTDGLLASLVPPGSTASADRCVLACATCRAQLMAAELDDKQWFGLREAVWSEVPAVQVMSVRLLRRLGAVEWARELLEQVYLADDVAAWADDVAEAVADDDVKTLDSNGAQLQDGDSVTLIKDLDVKGGGFVAKRGTLVKGIRLTGDPEHVEGKINKSVIVLKTKFLKKAT